MAIQKKTSVSNQPFEVVSEFSPAGDQPEAIAVLSDGVKQGARDQVLMGVTGSGKTFTMAQVIAKTQMPSLVLAPNKTLAAQLYNEFRSLFPKNAVEYFVSYYDFYQPEAYLPSSDTFIEKDAQVNDEIDKLRHSATRSLLARKDVIVVASVSCIYGLGSPEDYLKQMLKLEVHQKMDREDILSRLVDMQYERNDVDFHRGTFRVRGDTVEIFPSHEDENALRIELFGDEIETLSLVDPLRGHSLFQLDEIAIYPASHYVTDDQTLKRAMDEIRVELRERIQFFRAQDKLVEAQRLEQRTLFDLEMMEEMGFCKGIENYSRFLTGRKPGQPPPTLMEFFPRPYLLFVDESHVTVPQVGGMYKGDRSRKETLVEFGFRMPSALDNRPLRFEEFQQNIDQVIYVSATPGDFELKAAKGVIVEQVIRPTGLADPVVEVKGAQTQVDDLLAVAKERIQRGERVLATTLTKRMAEDLTDYFHEMGVRVRYLHSDIETIERVEIIRGLRKGDFDLLVGINLLREGLDLPEVSLVAILDADKEGFLRSHRSLIQTMGRASRNINGKVILYADTMTKSMQKAIEETDRRRKKQEAYNQDHGITPASVKRDINDVLETVYERDYVRLPMVADEISTYGEYIPPDEYPEVMEKLEKKMRIAAKALRFEEAIECRNRIKALKKMALQFYG